jgi:hypothetical protein
MSSGKPVAIEVKELQGYKFENLYYHCGSFYRRTEDDFYEIPYCSNGVTIIYDVDGQLVYVRRRDMQKKLRK